MAYIGAGITRFNTADDLTVTDDAEIGGDLTVTGSADINGGTIDGVTIGGASAGAGTFNALTVDGGTTNRVASFISTDANALIEFADDTTTNRPAIGAEGNDMTFSTNGEKVRIDTDGNVGIGTDSPDGKMHLFSASAGTVTAANGGDELVLENSGTVGMTLLCPNNSAANILFGDPDDNNVGSIQYGHDTNYMAFATNASERMRIDSSGNLLVGTTDTDPSNNGSGGDAGVAISGTGYISAARSGSIVALFNRMDSAGEIARFRKDGSIVGSIGTQNGSDFYITGTPSDDTGLRFQTNEIVPVNDAGANRDNFIDLGKSNIRFDDIFATNGTIQTSDRNEKQDIEELSEAEQRVAVAAKSLMRKFRWIDAVEEKGEDARIHFGIIAQDLQAAFEAEGLDAGRYAMFIYSEWWETYTDVPAVEAVDAVYETVTDEEGNETQVLVSEAVEAKDAYTRTDTYDTEEEAPEGAVKKSRMGVRYSELLAFIIAAI